MDLRRVEQSQSRAKRACGRGVLPGSDRRRGCGGREAARVASRARPGRAAPRARGRPFQRCQRCPRQTRSQVHAHPHVLGALRVLVDLVRHLLPRHAARAVAAPRCAQHSTRSTRMQSRCAWMLGASPAAERAAGQVPGACCTLNPPVPCDSPAPQTHDDTRLPALSLPPVRPAAPGAPVRTTPHVPPGRTVHAAPFPSTSPRTPHTKQAPVLTPDVVGGAQPHRHARVRLEVVQGVVEALQRRGLQDEVEHKVVQHKGQHLRRGTHAPRATPGPAHPSARNQSTCSALLSSWQQHKRQHLRRRPRHKAHAPNALCGGCGGSQSSTPRVPACAPPRTGCRPSARRVPATPRSGSHGCPAPARLRPSPAAPPHPRVAQSAGPAHAPQRRPG